jgi:hypothetical protein
MMKAAVFLCLLLIPEIGIAQTTGRIDPSYQPRTAEDRSFPPAPMLPQEIYESEEQRIAETFDKLKAEGEREMRAVPNIPNSNKVRRSDAVRVLNNAKRAVNDQFEDPEVARGLEAVQVPAGEGVPRGMLDYVLGEVFGIGRRNADDRRFNLHVTTQPPGAAFALCLQFQPSQPCLRVRTPGDFPGIHRSHYTYTVTLDGHRGGRDTLDLVHFGQRSLECTLQAVAAAQCSPR